MPTIEQKDLKHCPPKNHIDHLVANLLDFFRPLENHDHYFKAVAIAQNVTCRLLQINTDKLEKRFAIFASDLKDNINHQSLRIFATECLNSAFRLEPINNLNIDISFDIKKRGLRKKAQNFISLAIASGSSAQQAINHASHDLMKEKLRRDHEQKKSNIINSHPLKESLQSLQSSGKIIAPEDIRNRLLYLKRTSTQNNPLEGSLFALLQKTQSFSPYKLHQLLGDELYFYCRPLGFSDKLGTLLIIEVPSSSHLNLLNYRKPEILNALKADQTFKNTRNIRFKIRASEY